MKEDIAVLSSDEFVVGTRRQTGWGLSIALYFFFSGTGAALFLFSLIFHSPLGFLLDLLFLGVGVLILFLDLGNRWRFWKAFSKPQTSWISRGTFLIAILFLIDLFYFLFGFPGLPIPVLVLFGAVSVLVILYPGFVIAYSPSFSLWNNSFIPILFGLNSLANGLAILLLLSPSLAEREKGWGLLLAGLLILITVVVGIFILVSYASTTGTRNAMRFLVKGKWGGLFLFFGTGVGGILPLCLVVLFSGDLSSSGVLFFICLMRMAGDIGVRFAILNAGFYDPLI